MNEIEILEIRLRDIDKRRAEIDAILDQGRDGTYKQQELETERRELMGLRAATDNRIRSLNTPAAPAPEERRAKFIDQEISLRQRRYQVDIAQCEAAGDHRQARLWRGELLKVREIVEREFAQ